MTETQIYDYLNFLCATKNSYTSKNERRKNSYPVRADVQLDLMSLILTLSTFLIAFVNVE